VITKGISPFLSPNYDILHIIKQLVAVTPITIIGEWVKGHYSGKNRKIQHDMNDAADALAGQHLDDQDLHNGTNKFQPTYPGYKVRILKDSTR
jgi:hypothetical protein